VPLLLLLRTLHCCRGSKAYTVGRDESGAPIVTYIETVTVTPSTPHHGTGRYRLALCAGDSDITEYRVAFLNRASRREDKEISVPPLQVCAFKLLFKSTSCLYRSRLFAVYVLGNGQ
jgi:hypothetical protein